MRILVTAVITLTFIFGAGCEPGGASADEPAEATGDPTDDGVEEPGDGDEPDADAPVSPDERFGPAPSFQDEQTVLDLFEGIRIVSRVTDQPRPLRYHIVLVDPTAEGIDAVVTAGNGDEPEETNRQTTRAFAEEAGAAVAVNAHFFAPWPSQDPQSDVLGLLVSDQVPVSPFQTNWDVAFVWPIDGAPQIARWADGDETGYVTMPALEIEDAIGAQEMILTDGAVTANWEELHPRTAIGLTADPFVVLAVVDGRQDGTSEGVTTPELGELLLEFGVTDAINLDGGGSSTLVVSDPDPRLLNSPVGYVIPGTERDNGSNFGIRAQPR